MPSVTSAIKASLRLAFSRINKLKDDSLSDLVSLECCKVSSARVVSVELSKLKSSFNAPERNTMASFT